MANDIAEFTTSLPAIDGSEFSDKDIQCLRIYGLLLWNNEGITSPGITCSGFVNASTSLQAQSKPVMGSLNPQQIKTAIAKSLLTRAASVPLTSATTGSQMMTIIKDLRLVSQRDLDEMEAYLFSWFLTSLL